MRIERVECLICCLTSVAASTEFEERKGGDWENALSETVNFGHYSGGTWGRGRTFPRLYVIASKRSVAVTCFRPK